MQSVLPLQVNISNVFTFTFRLAVQCVPLCRCHWFHMVSSWCSAGGFWWNHVRTSQTFLSPLQMVILVHRVTITFQNNLYYNIGRQNRILCWKNGECTRSNIKLYISNIFDKSNMSAGSTQYALLSPKMILLDFIDAGWIHNFSFNSKSNCRLIKLLEPSLGGGSRLERVIGSN